MANRCFGRSHEQLEIGGTKRRHLWAPSPTLTEKQRLTAGDERAASSTLNQAPQKRSHTRPSHPARPASPTTRTGCTLVAQNTAVARAVSTYCARRVIGTHAQRSYRSPRSGRPQLAPAHARTPTATATSARASTTARTPTRVPPQAAPLPRSPVLRPALRPCYSRPRSRSECWGLGPPAPARTDRRTGRCVSQ